jgi:quercetin dioxygenase-like cupin family protein
MSTADQALEAKSAASPDEVRPFVDRGRVDVVHLSSGDAGHGVFEPGWRWSEHVKPIAGTDSCQVAHVGYVLRGRMHIAMDGGEEIEVAAGDFFNLPPGHDAWIVGQETCEMVDFGGLHGYAVPH